MSSPSTALTDLLVPTYKQNLQHLSKWLDKAESKEGVDASILSNRLAPDMFPLSTQVRFVCYQAQEAVYRLKRDEIPAGVKEVVEEARKLGSEGETDTFEAAKARIAEAVAFLESLEPDALDQNDSATQKLALELPEMGIAFDLTGEQFVRDWALPQFYFHTVTAYSILRSAGIELGKADYVPHMFAYLRPPAGAPAGKEES